ncbi:MAG: T9SS type A sorting domain-containing protein [bacterium]
MKRITILFFAFFLVSGMLRAQEELTLTWEGEPIEGTVYVFGSQFDAEIVAHAIVTNNTSQSRDIKVKRTQVEMQEGTLSQFCWGLCYPPNTDESPQFYTLGAGASSPDEYFSGHYLPNGIWGASTVEYEFFDANDEDVFVKMTVVYSATLASIGDNDEASFSLYPNPAIDKVTLEAESRIQRVSIFDLTGKQILTVPANDLKVVVDVQSLQRGIYLVRLDTERGARVEKMHKR